ncbi:BatD family protein [Williamwhitmania taraxaci]|uniref:Oxygen tolerance n=1 Tax=Williamwhitmania taraxaci TaxID=1640674 RepID=A0A1G6HVM6_9BACT|nr:BatD family protein [Williamwhitmania taraxaci]SDB98188.1 Oxygen tolerance [Williamwhitmania taraxaci]
MKRFILILLFACSQLSLFSQEVVFEASASQVVEVGERFPLTFTLNAKPSAFAQPEIRGFSVLAGPSQSSSSNFEVINGQVSQSYTLVYTYILQADKEGKYRIGSAEVKVNGKTYTSTPFEIEVVKGENSTNQADRSSQNSESESGDLFVRVELSKQSVYLGEALVATIKLYSRGVSVSNFENMTFPSFNGFWSQEIETPSQFVFQRESLNGKVYSAGVIKKWLLFPQQKGKIKIDPYILDCIIQVRGNAPQNIFDGFFTSSQAVKRKLVSSISTVVVKDLPANQPATFTGAVGNFTIESTIDRTKLKANEAASYRIKITGNGNLKLISAPKISFPPDFESYDPKITESIKSQNSGSTGFKIFEYPLIPRSAGDFTIPEVQFTFFDPQKGTYTTVKTSDIAMTVLPDPNGGSQVVSSGGVSKQDLKVLGKDIKYISIQPQTFEKVNALYITNWLYYVGYLLVIVISILLALFLSVRQKVKSDVLLYKNKTANKIAKKRLKNAAIALKLNDNDSYFDALHNAILGYLSDKLSIKSGELTSERAVDLLKEKSVAEKTISDLLEVLSICEFARYSPAATVERREEVYSNAVELISTLEQTIR